jgi:hypothetical protein
METNTHFLTHLAHFFLEGEMLQTKFMEKIKHTFYIQYFFSRKSCRLLDKWKNTEDPDRSPMTLLRMRITCSITAATDARSINA